MGQQHDEFLSGTEDRGKRLDIFLAGRIAALSREKAKGLVTGGRISINGVVLQKPDYRMKADDRVRVDLPDAAPAAVPPPETILLPVLYEDEHLLIVNKPAGVSTHPTPSALHNTVVNGLLSMNVTLSDMGDPLRRGIVHRLDKQTCGLLIIAKSNEAHLNLQRMFKQRTIHKTYIAVTYNTFVQRAGSIETVIARHPVDRKRMTTKTTRGRQAITEYRVLKTVNNATVVSLFPKTGRTHQLRTQLSDMGYPIVNDTLYSKKKPVFRNLQLQKMVLLLDGIALFAYALRFQHPVSGIPLSFTAPFPSWLNEVLTEHELS